MACFAAACALVGFAYCLAAQGDPLGLHVYLFWSGFLLFTLPCTAAITSARMPADAGRRMLMAVAVFDSLPKLLRGPGHLEFYDELAHYRQAEAVLNTGKLFMPNPLVPVAQVFPGLHALAATLAALTSLNMYQVAVVLLFGLHSSAVFGVFLLAETVGLGQRASATAALVYSVNPGFLYFDAQFAYQSLAIVLLIWTLLFLARGEGASGWLEQTAYYASAGVTASACVITHHISSYMLLLFVVILCLLWIRACLRGFLLWRALPLFLFTLLLMLEIASWTALVAQTVRAYLGPLATAWVDSLISLGRSRSPQRALFAGSSTPFFEHAAAFAAPPCAAISGARGLLVGPVRCRCPRMYAALCVYGALYFCSLPLMLTPGGNEAARRSWSFSAIGLAILIGPGFCRGSAAHARRLCRIGAGCCVGLCATVLAIGNTAMNTNELYRFPGAVSIGSDVRTQTPELFDAADWLLLTAGPGQRIIADRDCALVFDAFAMTWSARPWIGLPVWQLVFSPEQLDRGLLPALQAQGYRYLVVDRRVATMLPSIGYYFSPDEPYGKQRTSPVSMRALIFLDHAPWAAAIYHSANLTIYSLDYSTDVNPGNASRQGAVSRAFPAHTDSPPPPP